MLSKTIFSCICGDVGELKNPERERRILRAVPTRGLVPDLSDRPFVLPEISDDWFGPIHESAEANEKPSYWPQNSEQECAQRLGCFLFVYRQKPIGKDSIPKTGNQIHLKITFVVHETLLFRCQLYTM